MGEKEQHDNPDPGTESEAIDGLRQLLFPEEFRIGPPRNVVAPEPAAEHEPERPGPNEAADSRAHDRVVAELSTCLWYLKTRYFKRAWDDAETNDDEPRTRRALGRLQKTIQVLSKHGIEVLDPTDKRYPPGGEGMMRPIEFLPTPGLTFEVVNETIAPIIFRGDRLIRRGEVFVAVPIEGGETGQAETVDPADAEEQ